MALFRTTTETSRPVPATKRPHATIWSPGSKAATGASERCAVFAWPLSQLPGEESRKRPGILVADRGRDAGDGPVRGLQEMPGATHARRLEVIERALAGLGREPPEQRASTDIECGRQRDELVAVGRVLVELPHDPRENSLPGCGRSVASTYGDCDVRASSTSATLAVVLATDAPLCSRIRASAKSYIALNAAVVVTPVSVTTSCSGLTSVSGQRRASSSAKAFRRSHTWTPETWQPTAAPSPRRHRPRSLAQGPAGRPGVPPLRRTRPRGPLLRTGLGDRSR